MSNPPLKLDLTVPAKEATLPEEVEVIRPAAEESGGGGGQWGRLSDKMLHKKIDEHSHKIRSGFAEKLPDKGAKLWATLRQLRSELDSRELVKCRREKEDAEESAERGRFKTTQSSGVFHDSSRDSGPSCMPKESCSKLASASSFFKMMGPRSSLFSKSESSSKGKVKCGSSKKSGKQLHEINQPFTTSSRPIGTSSMLSPFSGANRLANRDKQNSATDYCRITESLTTPSPADKNFSISNSERKRPSDDRDGLQPSSKKVQLL